MNFFSLSTIEAKESFTELVNRVDHHKERIIITRRGKEIAALVPIEDFAELQVSQNKTDLQEALGALKEAREAGTVSLSKLKEEIGYDK